MVMVIVMEKPWPGLGDTYPKDCLAQEASDYSLGEKAGGEGMNQRDARM